MDTVYFFRQHQADTDEWPESKRPATLEAIARVRGEAVLDSALEAEACRFDADGLLENEKP